MKLTVGQLLDFIEKHGIPRDATVYYQRIEDVYFEKHGWTTIGKDGMFARMARQGKEDALSGNLDGQLKQSVIADMASTTEADITELQEQYISAFSPVAHTDESGKVDALYITAHY